MGDIEKSVKQTQEQLGKFVKKPPLTEKNLSRPPFRFLHDIVKNVIDTTGFMDGVFTSEELDAANVTSRDQKTAFMQKLVAAINERSGDNVSIKISKVLAGLEAENTNSLLQSLAKSIDLHQQSGGPKKPTKKSPTTKASKPVQQSSVGGAAAPSTTRRAGNKAPEKKEPAGAGTKRTIRDSSPASKQTGKKASNEQPGKGKPGGGAARKGKPIKPEGLDDQSVPESLVNDETNEEAHPARKGPVVEVQINKNESGGGHPSDEVELDRFGEATTTSTVAGHLDDDDINANNYNDNDGQHELYDNFTASVVKPNMQTLPPPKTPILTDADAVNATMDVTTPIKSLSPSVMTTSPIIGRGGSGRPPTGTGAGLSRETSAEQKGSPYGSASIGEVRPPTGTRSKPDTSGSTGSRLPSARPPSAARRGPPRPKSSVVKEDVEPYRPTTGKVAHVILDNTEDPDDDNYVVREVTITAASKAPGLSDLDETPELNLGGVNPFGMGGFGGEQLDDILPPDQRGALVNQILETQKELEDKKGGDGSTPQIEQKLKELSLAEIEKLKNLIQVCARSANPLAKLLDYMAEDVDSMQKEYINYREESKRLSLELENAKTDTDKFLQNLKHDLNEIERKIKDKQDGILASQMKIIQQEERIEEIVSGFERVRSGKSAAAAKEHMPNADEILAHIQGQTSLGGGTGYTGGGGPATPSVFTFSGGGNRLGSSTPSSAASIRTGVQPNLDAFKIPESLMVGGSADSGGKESSPFNRGRMWSSMANNNSANLDMRTSIDEDPDDQPVVPSMTRRSMGRSGGGIGGNNSGMMMDVDNFNPWS